MTRLLRVTGSTVCAGCEWRLVRGRWSVNPGRCAPILRWTVGKSAAEVKLGLMYRGLDYEWLSIT